MVDGTTVALLRPASGSQRLWLATIDDDVDLLAVLVAVGRPIRYSYVDRDWPIGSYQTVFADQPGSAEMPSAARPFTADLTTRLIRRGIGIATITLHTGVSSLEGHELPYAERFAVPPATAAAVNATRLAGGHVIAVGTTVVRALESAADSNGTVHPAAGWTDAVITPATGVRAVDGLVSGWHEPAATHLAMLEAVAGRTALIRAYRAAGTPATCGTSSATATCCFPTLGIDDAMKATASPAATSGSAAGGVSVPPPLPAGRRAVLYAVRRIGDATVDEIAEALDMTVSGARQHLTSLTEHGLVRTEELHRPDRRGRPQLSYAVTELADALFPKAYGALTNELLGYLDDEDGSTVDRLFARRRDARIANAERRLAPKRSLKAKVVELAQILDEDGYIATAEPIGPNRFRIVEHNCAIAAVARRYGQACTSELEFIRTVLPGAVVERTQHMVAGDRHCAYEIRAA